MQYNVFYITNHTHTVIFPLLRSSLRPFAQRVIWELVIPNRCETGGCFTDPSNSMIFFSCLMIGTAEQWNQWSEPLRRSLFILYLFLPTLHIPSAWHHNIGANKTVLKHTFYFLYNYAVGSFLTPHTEKRAMLRVSLDHVKLIYMLFLLMLVYLFSAKNGSS